MSRVEELEITPDELARVRLQRLDLLIVEGNGSAEQIGRNALFRGEIKDCIHQNHLIRVRADENTADPEYLSLYLNSPEGMVQMEERARTTTGLHTLSVSKVQSLTLPLPTLGEQRRLAAWIREELNLVERARAPAEAALDAATTLSSACIRRAFADVVERSQRRQLGELCEITAPQVDPTDLRFSQLPHVSAENIESGTCRLAEVKTAAEDRMISSKYLFERGNVLYSKLRPYLRKAVKVDFRGVCSADMYPLAVKESVMDPLYLQWLLVSDDFTAYADEESRRARMPKLNREQLLGWAAPVPPLAEQRRISVRVEHEVTAALRGRELARERADLVRQLPNALLHQAFSGGF